MTLIYRGPFIVESELDFLSHRSLFTIHGDIALEKGQGVANVPGPDLQGEYIPGLADPMAANPIAGSKINGSGIHVWKLKHIVSPVSGSFLIFNS